MFEQFHLDAVGVTGDRFVHGIVENFRREMVQGVLVGAADIHAGPAAHGLKALENFDVLCRVALGWGGRRVEKIGRFRFFCHTTLLMPALARLKDNATLTKSARWRDDSLRRSHFLRGAPVH